jgi:hypothetical protein
LLGCGQASDKPEIDLASQLDSGKSDMLKKTKLVGDIALDSTIVGTFDRKVRVYGYIVEAKRGAKLTISLAAKAGSDALGVTPGDDLDTIISLNGPYADKSDPGALIAQHDDDGDSLVPAPIVFDVEDDGRYLIAFSSWDDTGAGRYTLSIGCTGTDFQCRRPDWTKPCKAGTLYLQGNSVDESTTWDTCEVVMLEPTTVAKDAILTVKPGVVVKGNYLGTGHWGNVRLVVNGALQAAGTPEHPIAFTAFTETHGWYGIQLNSVGNTLSNVFIEKAAIGLEITANGSATVTDAVLDGQLTIGESTVRGTRGIQAGQDVEATFTRALVKNFNIGLYLRNGNRLFVEDSVVRENNVGVRVDGANASTSCYNPPPVVIWRDPVIRHSDIVENQQQGIYVYGSDVLLQVEKSNILNNGSTGIYIAGRSLHPDSYVRENNIHDNGNRQVQAYHSNNTNGGVLEISKNYWVHISDPQLSQSWSFPCNGQYTFTGFSPMPIDDAGPRRDGLIDDVKNACWSD